VSAPLRVVIADDHVPTRAGVRMALERHGFVVCAEESSGPAAVAATLREQPDVCLLDVHMPGSGITAAAEISERLPATAVVMLTVSRDDADLFDALKAGARGYLLKDTSPDRLGIALESVLKGEAALPRTLVARLVDEFRVRSRRSTFGLVRRSSADLTSREWQVLDLMAKGRSTAEIAAELFVSKTTVRRHVGSILKKLSVKTRAEAVRAARERSENLNA
jgi:DNA-binding NarL/FixJ family response regulator